MLHKVVYKDTHLNTTQFSSTQFQLFSRHYIHPLNIIFHFTVFVLGFYNLKITKLYLLSLFSIVPLLNKNLESAEGCLDLSEMTGQQERRRRRCVDNLRGLDLIMKAPAVESIILRPGDTSNFSGQELQQTYHNGRQDMLSCAAFKYSLTFCFETTGVQISGYLTQIAERCC